MKMRTFIGLCAALAFAAGSTTVHALMIVDAVDVDPAMDGRVSDTYAKETLLTTATTAAFDTSDTTMYYDIDEDDIFLSAPADITANAGDTYLVTYTLDGMVFRDVVAAAALTGATFTKAAGGAAGDKVVVFRLGSAEAIATTSTLLVLSAEFAISAAGSGSATRTVTNKTIADLDIDDVPGTKTYEAPGIIKLASGLKETSTAISPTATVEEGFRSFGDAAAAAVGSLQVTFDGAVKRADEANGAAVDDLTQIIDDGITGTAPHSTVSIMGDFSFATKAFLHGDNDCGATAGGTDSELAAAEPDILKREGTGDDEMVTGVNPQNVTAFAAQEYLCIMVDPAAEDGMRIPETAAYTAMGVYKRITDGAFDSAPMMQTLGSIKRDGSTVHLPYLTTNNKFNQRLYIVNRGPATVYEMEFQSGDTAGAMASGTLAAGSRTTLPVSDVVTIGEGTSTSGIIIIEASPQMIDAATVQVNRELGTTDTVVYD